MIFIFWGFGVSIDAIELRHAITREQRLPSVCAGRATQMCGARSTALVSGGGCRPGGTLFSSSKRLHHTLISRLEGGWPSYPIHKTIWSLAKSGSGSKPSRNMTSTFWGFDIWIDVIELRHNLSREQLFLRCMLDTGPHHCETRSIPWFLGVGVVQDEQNLSFLT